MSTYAHAHHDSITAGEALEKGVFISLDGSNQAVAADATSDVYGVTLNSCDSGDLVAYARTGIVDVQASAALTAHNAIGPDANGRAQDLADGAMRAAITLEETGVAADGSNYSYVKALLDLDAPGQEMRTLSISAGDEESDVIELTLQQNIARADSWYAVIIGNDDGLPEAASAYRLDATTGTDETTADQAGLIFTLTSDGEAVLEVTDVAGGSGATVTVLFKPLDSPGVIHRQDVTFD
jgi:hypothetical protein